MIKHLIISILIALLSAIAYAEGPPISEAEIKQRTETISKSLRCVVCQNQSIFESNAPLAEDMRKTVEARIRAGDTNDEVIEFLREPYGDFILMRPPFQLITFLLWVGPFFMLLGCAFWFFKRSRLKRPILERKELTEIDKARVHEALSGGGDREHS